MATLMSAKPTRTDAKKSYTAIIQAAKDVFYQHGAAVGLDEIIQQSGVSRATFFRHFANREQLMIALTDEGFVHLKQEAAHIKQQPAALRLLLEFITNQIIHSMAVFEYWWLMATPNHEIGTKIQQTLQAIFDEVIAEVRQNGQCRPDLTSWDILLFCRMLVGAALKEPPKQRAHAVRRAAELLLTGFGLE